jgi:hypothetical protein
MTSTELTAIKAGLIATGEAADSVAVDSSAKIIAFLNDNDTASVTGTGTAGGSANETAVTNVSVIDLGAGANDLVVLNSDDDSVNTIKFSADWGKVSVVNFESIGDIANTGVTGIHKLDFTAFLGNQIDPSVANGNDLSATTIASSINATTEVVGNDVLVWNALTFTGTDTFAGLTGAKLLAAIQDTNTGTADYAGITAASLNNAVDTNTLVQTTALKSIVMIENTANVGEYKVFELTANDTTNEFTAAKLVGTIDFGDTVTLTDANLA